MGDNQLKKDITMATNIINDNSEFNNCNYKKYSVIPIRGTENIKEVFAKMESSFEISCMVTGSGDQLLEAILHGAKVIYSFDINTLAKYGSALKFAAIEALEYEEFYDFYNKMFPFQLYKKVRECLKDNFLKFWDTIFENSYNFDIYHSLFDTSNHRDLFRFGFSIYLKDEYYQIKDKISKVKIYYETCNLMNLHDNSKLVNDYDFFYLSNIFYYIKQSPKQFSEFLLKDIEPLLKKGGEILFHYMYGVNTELSGFLFKDYDEKKSVIENFDKYLGIQKYFVKCSGYGGGYGIENSGLLLGEQDVALSLKKHY